MGGGKAGAVVQEWGEEQMWRGKDRLVAAGVMPGSSTGFVDPHGHKQAFLPIPWCQPHFHKAARVS